MKRFSWILLLSFGMYGCQEKAEDGTFVVSGEIKNADDQVLYLEQFSFNNEPPELVDSGSLQKGHFKLRGKAAEEGMYRIKLAKQEAGYIFINDEKEIPFTADLNDLSLAGPSFKSKANTILKNFLLYLDGQRTAMLDRSAKIESLKTTPANDSLVNNEVRRLEEMENNFKDYIIQFIDTVSDPVVAMFAIGYTRGIPPKDLDKAITGLTARFPQHSGVASVVKQFNTILAQPEAPAPSLRPGIGDMAPDFKMNDPEGKPFSLSQLKGKYVLVDFWASWCGPCREENPNVVAAYNAFKNKNFTVLGVSLDKDKTAWVNAIQEDNLNWKHVSDLQYWNSASVPLYGFDGIPYNVLIDPTGKIIATELREKGLHSKLAEVLK